ncbi:MAG: ParB/RepB/Spo0J family partition protein [Methylococcaceae bacterium]
MTQKKRGLGRGLNALLGDVPVKDVRNQLQHLPIEFLQRGKYQPRKDMNPEKLQELADSIKAQGVVQPIVVRKVDEDKYEIIAGERRWRASQLAGLQEIPVVIREVEDQSAMTMALIENIQREDLNPLEEAEALKRLLEEFEMTHLEVAEAVGKSRAMVTNLFRLIDLESEVKNMLAEGTLEMGHARALLAIQGEAQINAAKKVISEGLTVRATEQLVKDYKSPAASVDKPMPVVEKDPDTLKLQDELTAKLGSKVVINHQSNGKGKMVISYSSLDELEGVLSHMK